MRRTVFTANEDAVRSALAEATDGHGGCSRFARSIGVSKAYVSQTRKGKQLGAKIANGLGFELQEVDGVPTWVKM